MTHESLVQKFEATLKELDNQSDRGVAIVSLAMIEDILKAVIIHRLPTKDEDVIEPLFGGKNPFSGVASKIDVAYAIGAITKRCRKELILLNKVRNQFAHFVSLESPSRVLEALSFKVQKIVDLCSNLETIPQVRNEDPVAMAKSDARALFCDTVFLFCGLAKASLESDSGRPISM